LKKLYEENGPSQIRVAKVALNGYLKFKDSAEPYLRARAMANGESAKMLRLFLPACEDLAPNETVAGKARDVEARCKVEFGEMSDEQQQAARGLRDLLRERKDRLDRGEMDPITYPPTRWTTYKGDGEAPEVIRGSHDCAGGRVDLGPPSSSLGAMI
jgi:hypothetical protein